jgi:hypothetical protein
MSIVTEPPPYWTPGYPPPAGHPFPYPGTRPARNRLGKITRGVAIAVAVIISALILLGFVAYLVAPASTFTPTGDSNAANPAAGSPAQRGSSGISDRAWAADLTPFTALIGSGSSSTDAWNGAPCQSTSLGAVGERHSVTCLEPDGDTVFVSTFSTAGDVQRLVSGAVQSGGTSATWTAGGQPLGETVTNEAGGDTTVTTTFDQYPTALIAVMGPNPNTVTTDWQSAPLPH